MAGVINTDELIPQAHASGIPDNYQTEHATPDTFGANIGQALEKAGNEAASTTGFYQQIASDHATNQLLDLDTKIKYGDPAVQGDTGIMGLKGSAAMSALPAATKRWDDGLAAIRANLTSPYEQLQFDTMSRRYRAYAISAMSQHADQQQTQWAGEVNKASGDINLNAIAKASTDPNSSQLIPFYTNRLVDARVKDAMAHGAQAGDVVVQAAAVDAHREALKAQVLAMSATPQGAEQAQKLLESQKDIAGTEYPILMAHVRTQASQYHVDQGIADSIHQASVEHQNGTVPSAQPTSTAAFTGGAKSPPDVYANIPDVDKNGRSGQVAKFKQWNPDPIGNEPAVLASVHPDLQAIVNQAKQDNPNLKFVAALGKTTPAQGELAKSWGWSQTGANSQHNTGNVVDLWPLDDKNRVDFDSQKQQQIGAAMKKAAEEKGLSLRWGGLQGEGGANKSFRDAPNFELVNPKPVSPSGPVPGTGYYRQQLGGAAAAGGYVPGKPVTLPVMQQAIFGQESGNNDRVGNSFRGAIGPGQIMPGTFGQYAKPGESIHDPRDNRAVNARILQDYINRYNGDPARIAVAYFSGPGNVAPMAFKTPWIKDSSDGRTLTSQYVSGVLGRLGQPGISPERGVFPTVTSSSLMLNEEGIAPAPQMGQSPPQAIAVQPQIAGGTEAPELNPPPSPQAVTPVSYSVEPHETSPAGYNAMAGSMQAMSIAARAMQIWGERTDITPEERESGFVKLRRTLAEAQFAADATQQQIKQQSNQAAKGYIPRVIGGDASVLADISRDGNLEFSTQMELLRMAKEQGLEGAAGMGPDYNDALKRIALHFGDPNRISNYTQLLQMRNNGQLSDQGLSKVAADMEKIKQQDFQGVVTAKSAVLDSVKQAMTYGEEGNFPGALKDPKGKAAYDKFVVAFEAAFDQQVTAGKNPFDFLTDEKAIKRLANTIRSPEDKYMDQIAESKGNEVSAYDPTAETRPVPPPPAKISQDTWNQVIAARPTVNGHQIPADKWGNGMADILTKPQPVQQAILESFLDRFHGQDLAPSFARLLAESQGPSGPPARPVSPTPAGGGTIELPQFDVNETQPGQPMPGMVVSP